MSVSSVPVLPANLEGLSAREAVADAVYRFYDSFDNGDEAALRSALVDSPDTLFEITGMEPFKGIAPIIQTLGRVGPMDTTHHVTNLRIELVGGAATATTARVTGKAINDHFLPGTGVEQDSRSFRNGNKFHGILEKDPRDGLWKVKHLSMNIVWIRGDRAVMTDKA